MGFFSSHTTPSDEINALPMANEDGFEKGVVRFLVKFIVCLESIPGENGTAGTGRFQGISRDFSEAVLLEPLRPPFPARSYQFLHREQTPRYGCRFRYGSCPNILRFIKTTGCAPYPAHFRSGYEARIQSFLYPLTKFGSGVRLRFSSYQFLNLEKIFRYGCSFRHGSCPNIL